MGASTYKFGAPSQSISLQNHQRNASWPTRRFCIADPYVETLPLEQVPFTRTEIYFVDSTTYVIISVKKSLGVLLEAMST